jgi:hypothetical protein
VASPFFFAKARPTRANPLERHLRDALYGRVHSPRADTVLGQADRVVLGLASG